MSFKTDNGSPFQSYEFAAFARKWGFKHRRVTPLWPRANGEVESFMKQLGKVIRIAGTAGIKREQALQDFLRTYRATPTLHYKNSTSSTNDGTQPHIRNPFNSKA